MSEIVYVLLIIIITGNNDAFVSRTEGIEFEKREECIKHGGKILDSFKSNYFRFYGEVDEKAQFYIDCEKTEKRL